MPQPRPDAAKIKFKKSTADNTMKQRKIHCGTGPATCAAPGGTILTLVYKTRMLGHGAKCSSRVAKYQVNIPTAPELPGMFDSETQILSSPRNAVAISCLFGWWFLRPPAYHFLPKPIPLLPLQRLQFSK